MHPETILQTFLRITFIFFIGILCLLTFAIYAPFSLPYLIEGISVLLLLRMTWQHVVRLDKALTTHAAIITVPIGIVCGWLLAWGAIPFLVHPAMSDNTPLLLIYLITVLVLYISLLGSRYLPVKYRGSVALALLLISGVVLLVLIGLSPLTPILADALRLPHDI